MAAVLEACALQCLPKLKNEDQERELLLDGKGKPVVYKRRWLILAAFAVGFYMWNLHTLRQIPLVAEYADFFDTTNEFRPLEGDVGVDFLNMFDNLLLVVFYPLSGFLVDSYGLKMMVLGSIVQTASVWWFYLAKTNFISAIFSRIPTSIGGALISSCFLRITNTWFPAHERPIAIGIGVIVATAGSGSALVFGSFFYENDGEAILDLELKSCKDSFKDSVDFADILNQTCSDQAQEDFCCRIPTRIEEYNFILAILSSVITIYTILVTRELPPTTPSKAGNTKKSPSFFTGMKLMFSNRNYTQLCLADFIMSGPPQVLFSVLSRVLPPSVQEYDFIAGAAGLVLSLPAGYFFSKALARTQKFYDFTAWAYTLGLIFWALATLCLAIGIYATDIIFLVLGAAALITLIMWTISVFELKMEFVFSEEYNLEGFVVGIDRTILNLSSLIFLAAIPPERIKGDLIPARLFTFVAGLAFMIIGVITVWTMPHKRLYQRKAIEEFNEEVDETLGPSEQIIEEEKVVTV